MSLSNATLTSFLIALLAHGSFFPLFSQGNIVAARLTCLLYYSQYKQWPSHMLKDITSLFFFLAALSHQDVFKSHGTLTSGD